MSATGMNPAPCVHCGRSEAQHNWKTAACQDKYQKPGAASKNKYSPEEPAQKEAV